MRRNKGIYKDIKDLIEHVSVTIVKAEGEEQFYRRWADATAQEEAKAAMLEIAAELERNRMKLEAHREKLWQSLDDLETQSRHSRG